MTARVSGEYIEQIRHLYWVEELNTSQIAQRVNVTGSAIRHIMSRYHIQKRTQSEYMKGVNYKQLDMGLIQKLYCEEHLSITEISDICHIAKETVRDRLVSLDIPIKPPSEFLKIQIDMQQIKKLYCEDLFSANQIGRQCGCNGHVILRHLRNTGIPIRSTLKGSNHHAWRGGRFKNKQGYWLVYIPEHPNCYKGGYILEHRLVTEKIVGRYLLPTEDVHHIDLIRSNNSPDNLCLFESRLEHREFHKRLKALKKVGQSSVQTKAIISSGTKYLMSTNN